VSMDREEHEITFSVTALSVYAVSCLFFIFLVASLYIIGLTPWRACLGRERSSDNLDQVQEETIEWVIQKENKSHCSRCLTKISTRHCSSKQTLDWRYADLV